MGLGAALIDWSPDAEAALSTANATPADLALWREQRGREEVQLWQFTGDSEGYLLTRVEQTADEGRELVLIAGAGVNARPVLRWVTELAQRHGFTSIRTHIKRAGLQRIYEAQGWHLAEKVMRVNIHGR